MKIAVAIITRGRPEILCETLRQLERQERPPDQLILSATCRDDIEGAEEIGLWRETDTICGAPGVSLQRNRARRTT